MCVYRGTHIYIDAHSTIHACTTHAPHKDTNEPHMCTQRHKTPYTCKVIGTHDTHTCIYTHAYTKQYTHTHKIAHIAHTCTHTYGNKPVLFLILSVSLQHCHLFSLRCWKMFTMISSVSAPPQAG